MRLRQRRERYGNLIFFVVYVQFLFFYMFPLFVYLFDPRPAPLLQNWQRHIQPDAGYGGSKGSKKSKKRNSNINTISIKIRKGA